MMSYDVEKKAEELLAAIGTELAKSRAKYADDVLARKEPPFFAEQPAAKFSAKRRLKRTVILVAILVMLMGLFVATATGVSEKVFNYFAERGNVSTRLKPLEKYDTGGVLPNFELAYLPEGYKLVSESKDEVLSTKVYVSDEKQYIEMSVQRSEDFIAEIDNETMTEERVRVNVYQAHLFYDDMLSYIVWQVGDYTLDIIGHVTKDEIIKIAESMSLL